LTAIQKKILEEKSKEKVIGDSSSDEEVKIIKNPKPAIPFK
jgi:hypothetical protein